MSRPGDRDRVITAAGIIGILLVAWFAYAPGLDGSFTFDDAPNLQQLANVDDRVSAIRFVFTGKSGPLGRPLALASFLPQADDWDDGARAFLTINVLIHLLNGMLVIVFLRLLALAHGVSVADAAKVALLGGALWISLPVLASSSLIVVQRMTLMSATFMLLGLIGYLLARGQIDRKPTQALVGMSASLIVAAVLAALCKENGALLPTLVLVIEATLLARPMTSRIWTRWISVFLVAPTLVIGVYLVYRGFYSQELALMRDFSGGERLMTQARILWEYLFRAFVPLPGMVLPYNDGHAVARTIAEPLTLIAIAGWIAAVLFAVRLRRRYPIIAFAVLWYLAGHLLESTSLPLELVFDHRNYIPMIGPVFLLACLPLSLAHAYRPLAFASLVIYAVLMAVSLHGFTSRMGQPAVSAAFWHEHAPSSVRAATNLAQQRMVVGDIDGALMVQQDFVVENPENAYLLIQDLNFACLLRPGDDHRVRVAALMDALPTVDFALTAGPMLNELLRTVSQVECNGVGAGTVSALAAALMQNPRYAAHRAYSRYHHQLMASIYRSQDDLESALDHLRDAAAIGPSIDTVTMTVMTHVEGEDSAAARQTIDAARADAPLHPAKRFLWQYDLDELGRFVDSVRTDGTGTR